MKKEIQAYLDYIIANYQQWQNMCNAMTSDEVAKRIRDQMFEEFKQGLEVQEGSKYIKIIQNRSVHSFIVKKDTKDGKFKTGDILKAASWAAPAKNFKRGNILTGDFGTTSWTGA